jgi:hypothetical protein
LGFCWAARQVGERGFVPALSHIAEAGPDPASLPLSAAATGVASGRGVVVAVVLFLIAVPLTALSVRAAARATPEQLLSRSRRAEVTKTALRLGFTSSAYLSRTEPVRRSRRKRRALPTARTPGGAVLTKAWLQEQGTPVWARLLVCAAVIGTIVASAVRVTPGPSSARTVVWAAVFSVALTLVATRFADPVRLDVDAAPLAGSVPVTYTAVGTYDVMMSAAHALTAACVGVGGAAALGVLQSSQVPAALLAGAVIAMLMPAAGALGALSNDPSPFLPPALALGYRTSGFIAVSAVCVSSGLLLRTPTAAGSAQSRLPFVALLMAVVVGVTALAAVTRTATALRRGR